MPIGGRGWAGIARLAILGTLVVFGLWITPHYGESWDERQFFKYADRALDAYGTWPRSGTVPVTGNTYDNYGPAYVMLAALGARCLELVIPWSISDLRHLVYFATFVAGLWAFHRLARRWLGRFAALGATLLLATQPLIWGHAFISPKDIPFLTFFVLTIVLGFEMVDRLQDEPAGEHPPRPPRRLLLLTGAWLLLVLGAVITTPIAHSLIKASVLSAAAGESNLVSRFATDLSTVEPDVYVQRYFVLYLRVRAALLLLLTATICWTWRGQRSVLRQLAVVALPAIVLGLTTSIRILGPIAALIVIGYALHKLGRRAVPALLAYGFLGTLAMYVTWPYLWPDPLGHLIESALVMSRYPWGGVVLFNGAYYPSTELPASYLPVLLALQLTEPAWLLIIAGAIVAALDVFRGRAGRGLLVLAVVWFALPAFGFSIARAPLYVNFRQVLFILPPLFILAGVALEKIQSMPTRAALVLLSLLPGVISGLQLHPYEYVYYNHLIGGVPGAFRRFELDYWGTSYREAAYYIGHTAEPNAAVWVEGPAHLFQEYARQDLKTYSTYEAARADHYDYVVALTRYDLDLNAFPEASVDHVIERQGAWLTVIKKP